MFFFKGKQDIPDLTAGIWIEARGWFVEKQDFWFVQQCNTECQERFSQCLVDCDGNPSCKRGCKDTVASCVAACSKEEAPGGTVDAARGKRAFYQGITTEALIEAAKAFLEA